MLSCNGQQPTICTGSGTLQNVGNPCSGSTAVCLSGACVTCAPGTGRCIDQQQQPQECDSAGTWQNGTACTSSEMCDAGVCIACTAVEHSDGLGQTFQDCVPAGTINQQLAEDACRAASGSYCAIGGQCAQDEPDGGQGYTNYFGWENDAGGCVAGWGFMGAGAVNGAGHVKLSDGGGCCPTSSDPAYQ
ncbi:MAG: hypothetical protein ACRELB_20680 [Polyangiaceae bacterium]